MTPARFSLSLAWLREHGMAVAVEGLVNILLPYLVYVALQPTRGDVAALLWSSLPPIAWSLIEFARKRRIDAVSVLVLLGIALSLLAFVGGGSVRMLQLRENLVTGLIGLAFLGSAAIGKPLIYQLAYASMQRRSAVEATNFAQLRVHGGFRRTMMVMTLVWGFGLLVQTALACVLVFELPIARYLLVSPFLGYGCIGLLTLWTYLYARRAKRLGAAARAKAEAATSSSSISS